MGCGGDFVQVWPQKWAETRIWLPNLREMWARWLVVVGLAAKAQKKQPTWVWAGCFIYECAGY